MNEKKPDDKLTIAQIIAIASEAYPDGKIQEAFDAIVAKKSTRSVGDMLAVFLAQELLETFEDDKPRKEQLQAAMHAMDVAYREVRDVSTALLNANPDLKGELEGMWFQEGH